MKVQKRNTKHQRSSKKHQSNERMHTITETVDILKMLTYHGMMEIDSKMDADTMDESTYNSLLDANLRSVIKQKVGRTSATDAMKYVMDYGMKKAIRFALQQGYLTSQIKRPHTLLYVMLEERISDAIDHDEYKSFKEWHDQSNCYCKNVIAGGTIVSGIKCKQCSTILPEHTVEQHLDSNHPIHTCPHKM